MKTILTLSILFSVIALPALGELTDADLDKIRLIVKDEVSRELTPLKADIVSIKADIGSLKTDVASLSGRLSGIEKMMTWLMVIIVVAVGLPQVVIAWRSRKDQALEKQLQTLTEEIETLKEQRIVKP
ncbi:hypothetical protein C6499_14630 [Candidatus Poribacteria bacterium]|nr:MAG: hypothetical protein C6499_14630 [Candidatus Poribacteria bacterium]